LYDLDEVLNGGIQPFVEALALASVEEQLGE
jgi:hypothetical protein